MLGGRVQFATCGMLLGDSRLVEVAWGDIWFRADF